ncbi:MAG: histidine kinase [Myxococcales bacterium]|nr:histidine kinase [Myxococcales bacterium]
MNLEAQSGLLAAIVSVAVGISALLRGRRVQTNVLFTVFSANLVLHFLAAFFHRISGRSIWFQADLAAAAALPVTALLFFGNFLWRDPRRVKPFLLAAAALSSLLIVFLITPWSQNDISVGLVVGYAFAGLYLCAAFIYARRREIQSPRERTWLRYLLVVLLAAVTFVLLGILPGPLGFLRAWGDLVAIFFLYFISQSLVKYRLLDLQEMLGRGLVLIAVSLILAVVFWVLVYWTGGSADFPLFHIFVGSFVILILFEPVRDKLESSPRRLLSREGHEVRRRLEELRRDIATRLDPRQMSEAILEAMFQTLRQNAVSVYLQDEGGASYRRIGFRGPEPPLRLDVAAHRTFFEQLRKTPTVILAETFEQRLADGGVLAEAESPEDVKRARQVLETLATLKAGACVPFVGQKDEILGLWFFHDPAAAEGYSTVEIASLMAVAEQAAVVIENSRVLARVRERDRLAVLGQMAAGLAHEIRNPLGAIKGAAQYLDPAAVGDDASEFLKIIIEETDRLNQVVDQFLDYARPLKATQSTIDLNEVVSHTLKLFSPTLPTSVTLKTELAKDLPALEGNAQQLTQVFLNLLRNALEATPEGGCITVRTLRTRDHSEFWAGSALRAGAVQVEIQDTGKGIPPEALERIFVPFYTTKDRGTGLGLAICQRLIENHNGEIRVWSRPGEGSTFRVFLPARAPAETAASAKSETPAGPEGGDLPFPPSRDRGQP